MNSKKDDRWSKQLGDFGESLVMYLLGNLKKTESGISGSYWCRYHFDR